MSLTGREPVLPRALLFTLAIAGCSLGLLVGWLATGGFPLQAKLDATPTAVPPTSQPLPMTDAPFGVLVGMLDQAVSPPRLRGAWLIYTLPDAHKTYLQGLPYDLQCAPAGAAPLRLDEVYLTADAARGDSALRGIAQRIFPAQTVDYLVILNATTLDELAIWLEPVTISGRAPGTPPSSLWYDLKGSDATLTRQEEILTGFLAALHRTQVDQISASLYGSVKRTGRTDMSQEQFRRFLRYLDAFATVPAPDRFLRLDPARQYCQP